jgi:hypothetical protein
MPRLPDREWRSAAIVGLLLLLGGNGGVVRAEQRRLWSCGINGRRTLMDVLIDSLRSPAGAWAGLRLQAFWSVSSASLC